MAQYRLSHSADQDFFDIYIYGMQMYWSFVFYEHKTYTLHLPKIVVNTSPPISDFAILQIRKTQNAIVEALQEVKQFFMLPNPKLNQHKLLR